MAGKRTKIVLDFNTKFISPNKRVWVVFPGEGYKFYDQFMEGGSVFADLPGFLVKQFDISNDGQLKSWIALSEKVRASYTRGLGEEKRPSREPEAYKNFSWTGRRINTKGIVNGLYGKAKKGDLVLTPSRGGQWGATQIGEFITGPDGIVYETTRRYGNEKIPARRVKWVGSIENRFIPEEFWRQLISPNAFSLVGKQYYDFVFERAYGNYIRTDSANSLFEIKAEEFSTVPDMYLKLIANVAAEIARGLEEDNLQAFMDRPFEDWFFDIEENAFFANQHINISSPGKNFLQSVKMTPILAVVLFALCQYPAAELKAAELVFENSATGGELDECDIPVADGATIAHKLMSLEKFELLCRAAVKAERMGKIRTPIRTRIIK